MSSTRGFVIDQLAAESIAQGLSGRCGSGDKRKATVLPQDCKIPGMSHYQRIVNTIPSWVDRIGLVRNVI